MAATEELTLRPVRPADYDRIVEITQDVWEGHDYIPRVFDRWVSDSAASFQAAELDGEVVGVQRTRPFAPGLVWYEGLRVASSHHRQGIAPEDDELRIGKNLGQLVEDQVVARRFVEEVCLARRGDLILQPFEHFIRVMECVRP